MTSALNSSRREAIAVTAIPAFRDNYIWLIRRGGLAAVVDPGDAEPVETALRNERLTLAAIVLTHHHHDHVGGVAALAAARPGLDVFGPSGSIARVTKALSDGETVDLGAAAAGGSGSSPAGVFGLTLSTLEVPGHTLDHVAYFGGEDSDSSPMLFCGDTLFAAGCGRLFEGTAEQMHRSLSRLAALPGETRVYCGHEYTLANLEFAAAVEPGNAAIQARLAETRALRANGDITLPSTIALELQTNPFLRCDRAAVRAAAEAFRPGSGGSAVSVFAAIRAWKNDFRPPAVDPKPEK